MPALPDMIGINVRDMSESLRFYRLLGLDIPSGVEGEEYVDIISPNGYRISWNSLEMIKSIEPDWVEPVGHRMALAFKCDSPTEVDAMYEQVVQNGFASHKEPWDAFWGQRYATVVDPDGNNIDLFAPLPNQ